MRKLYIIAGCNGAGKTTASYTILPEILNCKEFVNADEIAKGLSPLRPEKAIITAGRLMLKRIKLLLGTGENFAFETTLSTRSYVKLVEKAKKLNYQITCIFFWLYSEELAILRVKTRVKEGGHHIPEEVIRRRYKSGLKNFFNLFLPSLDNWLFVDNSGGTYEIIAEGSMNESTPKTSFYYKWLQNPISLSLGKIFPLRSYGYACGPPSRFAVHSLEDPPDLHPSGSFAHLLPRS